MGRTRKISKIPLAGYVPMQKLLMINRDALRAMPKDEKQATCKEMLREIIRWSMYSNYEAIGLLQSAQFHFLQMAEDESIK